MSRRNRRAKLTHEWDSLLGFDHKTAKPRLGDDEVTTLLPHQRARANPWPLDKRFCMYVRFAINKQHIENLDGKETVCYEMTYDPQSFDPTEIELSPMFYGPTLDSVIRQFHEYQTPEFSYDVPISIHNRDWFLSSKIRIVDFASYCGIDTKKEPHRTLRTKKEALHEFLASLME